MWACQCQAQCLQGVEGVDLDDLVDLKDRSRMEFRPITTEAQIKKAEESTRKAGDVVSLQPENRLRPYHRFGARCLAVSTGGFSTTAFAYKEFLDKGRENQLMVTGNDEGGKHMPKLLEIYGKPTERYGEQ